MKKNDLPVDLIVADYNDGMSPYELATKYNTYSNMIRRLLIRNGITLRNKSDAQKNAIAKGTVEHPTAGKKHSSETLIKMSRGLSESYQNLSSEEKKRRSDKAKAQWDAMSDEKKREFSEAAVKGVLLASKEGSKLEKSLMDGFRNLGYFCKHHSDVIANEKMEVDIFIPELKVCIEVDGPAHFLPIWGEDKLKKVQESDAKKNGLLVSHGYVVVRIRTQDKPSLAVTAELINSVDEILKRVKVSFPPIADRCIELTV